MRKRGRADVLILACLCAAAAACDTSTPPTPDLDPGPGAPAPGVEQITGAERLGWTQPAATVDELATFRYAMYVDNVRTDLGDASCTAVPAATGFECMARLPQMSPGRHSLEVSAFLSTDPALESARSAPLQVSVSAQATTGAPTSGGPALATTADGIRLRADIVVRGLQNPTDLAFLPDGRLLIAERTGRFRIVRDGILLPAPAAVLTDVVDEGGGGLLAIALDPDFEHSRLVYAVYTAAAGFRLARFREVGNTLGNRAIVLDGVPSSHAGPGASLRFGPDATLHAGFDDGGDARRGGDLGSFNGKVLRLNPDATTPADQAGGSPVYALHLRAPRGVDWHAATGTMWVVDAAAGGRDVLHVVENEASNLRRGRTVARYVLPEGTGASNLAFYRGNLIPALRDSLLIAAGEGRAIIRLRLDPSDPRKIVATERLLQNVFGPVRALGVTHEGVIYICTDDAVVRILAG